VGVSRIQIHDVDNHLLHIPSATPNL
jgi:hypothetical protein